MPSPIILSKRHMIGHRSEQRGRYGYLALRDIVGHELRNGARKTINVAIAWPSACIRSPRYDLSKNQWYSGKEFF